MTYETDQARRDRQAANLQEAREGRARKAMANHSDAESPDARHLTYENCPFCDNQFDVGPDNSSLRYWISCEHCGATGPEEATPEEALAAWNGWVENARKRFAGKAEGKAKPMTGGDVIDRAQADVKEMQEAREVTDERGTLARIDAAIEANPEFVKAVDALMEKTEYDPEI